MNVRLLIGDTYIVLQWHPIHIFIKKKQKNKKTKQKKLLLRANTMGISKENLFSEHVFSFVFEMTYSCQFKWLQLFSLCMY